MKSVSFKVTDRIIFNSEKAFQEDIIREVHEEEETHSHRVSKIINLTNTLKERMKTKVCICDEE